MKYNETNLQIVYNIGKTMCFVEKQIVASEILGRFRKEAAKSTTYTRVWFEQNIKGVGDALEMTQEKLHNRNLLMRKYVRLSEAGDTKIAEKMIAYITKRVETRYDFLIAAFYLFALDANVSYEIYLHGSSIDLAVLSLMTLKDQSHSMH